MRVVVFLSGYLPAQDYGGPVRSFANLAERLGDRIEIFIVAGEHEFRKTERLPGLREGWNEVGKAKVLYLPDAAFTKARFSAVLSEIRPDLVYLSSIFSYHLTYSALRAAKAAKIPIILAPRGELDARALQRRAPKKRIFLGLMKRCGAYRGVCFHATCEEEGKAVREILRAKDVAILPNLPALPEHKTSDEKQAGRLRVCSIARILPNKNQLLSIQAAAAAGTAVELDLYGPIEDREYWSSCEDAMKAAGSVRIRYCGKLRPEEVGPTLLRYDCFLLPTIFENYCHSIAEALLHDCPVIISRGTTPWDGVAEAGCGWTVPLDRPEGLREALLEAASLDREEYAALLQRLRVFCDGIFQTDALEQAYLELFRRVAGKD